MYLRELSLNTMTVFKQMRGHGVDGGAYQKIFLYLDGYSNKSICSYSKDECVRRRFIGQTLQESCLLVNWLLVAIIVEHNCVFQLCCWKSVLICSSHNMPLLMLNVPKNWIRKKSTCTSCPNMRERIFSTWLSLHILIAVNQIPRTNFKKNKQQTVS